MIIQYLSLSNLFQHNMEGTPCPFMLLQMAKFFFMAEEYSVVHLCVYVCVCVLIYNTSSLPIHLLSVDEHLRLFPYLGNYQQHCCEH